LNYYTLFQNINKEIVQNKKAPRLRDAFLF
jgi:hypothetical protein